MMTWHRRLFPHPLVSLLLLPTWLLLNNSAAAGHWVLGTLLATLIPLYTRRFWPDPAPVRRPALAARLVGRVLGDILVANFRVARLVIGPQNAIRPRFVQVPLDVQGDVAVTVLTSVVSLTPGTVSADIDPDRRHLLVHALSEDDPDQLIGQIKSRYEAPIKEIFAC